MIDFYYSNKQLTIFEIHVHFKELESKKKKTK